jgi:hypothetical protein
MGLYLEGFDHPRWMSLGLAVVLMLGAVTAHLNFIGSIARSTTTTHVLTDDAAQEVVGSGDGGCGIAVGIATGIVILAVGGATIGLGAAFALSAGLHVAAIYCAS